MKFGWKPALQHPRVQQKRSGKILEAVKCQTLRVLPFHLATALEKAQQDQKNSKEGMKGHDVYDLSSSLLFFNGRENQ